MLTWFQRAGAAGLLVGVLSACSTTHYKESADQEVYGIINAKSPAVPGMVKDIDIEPPQPPDLSGLPINESYQEFLGPDAEGEVGAAVLSLERALEIAFSKSREYQTRKEQLYLEALALTLDRHEFAPIFSGVVAADAVWSSRDVQVQQFRDAMDTMTGDAGRLLRDYSEVIETSGALAAGTPGGGTTVNDTIRETSLQGTTSFGFNKLMKGGTQIAVDLTSSFLGFLSGVGSDSAATSLAATISKPLLRGAGREVNAEFLTQAERDVLYELRDFTRFRKTFAVRVASQYYQVLQNKDAVRTNYQGLQSFELSLERERAFQAEGLRTAADVGRLEQSKLSRDASWTRSLIRYKQSLDDFKVLLGYSTDAPVILDDGELRELIDEGIRIPTVQVAEAVDVALVTRLDLYTNRDRVYDAERQIEVAANLLEPQLDLVFTGDVDSKPGNRFASLDWSRSEWSAGVLLDLPFDRKAERNNFRRALINYELAQRNASLAEDEVKLDVRDAHRTLVQAQKDYEISVSSVELNRRRVEEEELRAELGLGDIIDQVDAQNDLTNAETSLTSSIVAHRIALLQFWRDIGILYIKEDGSWEEITDV